MRRGFQLSLVLIAIVIFVVAVSVWGTSASHPVAPEAPCTHPAVQGAAAGDQTDGLIRLQRVMAKARRGEDVLIAGIGGSITEGVNATPVDNRYLNQVYAWWTEKYPGQVTLTNAGVGGTGSAFGTHRVEKALLNSNPDFVIVEFAVNDLGMPLRQKTYEGLIRKILNRPNQPAVLLLYFMVKNGSTTQADFEPIAECYQLPQVSFADRITQLVQTGQVTLDDVYADDVHPNTRGHVDAGRFINEYLDAVYNHLPADDSAIAAVAPLPSPLYADTFQYTQFYNNETIVPDKRGNWKNGYFSRGSGAGWVGSQVGDELTFNDLWGTDFGIAVRIQRSEDYGIAEVWVDDGPHTRIDVYLPTAAGSWPGPNPQYYPVAENLTMTQHSLHVKIIEDKNPEVSANDAHTFELMNVFVDGALVDHLNDWSYVYSHTPDFEFDTRQVRLMEGDAVRVHPVGAEPGEIVWAYRHLTDFEAVLFYPPETPVQHNEFYTSADGVNWMLASPAVQGGDGNWVKYVYTLRDLTDVNYVKTRWPGAAPAPELSQVTIFNSQRGQE